jgi:hypothetical protein
LRLTQQAVTSQLEGGVYVEDLNPVLPAELQGLVVHSVAGEEVASNSYDDVLAKLRASKRPLTIQFSKKWSLQHTWTEANSPLGLKLTQLGTHEDATEGVYVEDAAPFLPEGIKGLVLERIADQKVSNLAYDNVLEILKAASRPVTLEFTKPVGSPAAEGFCKWRIQSHGSQKYVGLDSPFVFMYRDGQSHDELPATMAIDTADLPEGWSVSMDQALAQFCSKHAGKLGSMEQLQSLCQSTNGQQVFAPLLRLCGSDFPAVIRTRAESMSHISKMAVGVINVLPFGDPDHVLLRSFSMLAPLVFASDKKPAIDAAMAQFSKPTADKPSLTVDRFAMMDDTLDPTGERTMFGQIAKGMTNRGHAMFGISTYHGTNPQFWNVSFTGEEGIDAGGLFRDTISNIADELMSDKTPVFIKSGNAIAGTSWVPNPACHNVQQYKFIGQLMGACIRTGETLGIDLAPFFWKKLGGGAVNWADFVVHG